MFQLNYMLLLTSWKLSPRHGYTQSGADGKEELG